MGVYKGKVRISADGRRLSRYMRAGGFETFVSELFPYFVGKDKAYSLAGWASECVRWQRHPYRDTILLRSLDSYDNVNSVLQRWQDFRNSAIKYLEGIASGDSE